jgi:hypothetical protein
MYRLAAAESADDGLHPVNSAPYTQTYAVPNADESADNAESSAHPLYHQQLLSYEQEFPAYEAYKVSNAGGPSPDDVYVPVIGAKSVTLPIADFNTSLPIPDPLAVLRDSSSAELKAIYNQFRPIIEQTPVETAATATATDEADPAVAAASDRHEYGASSYAYAFQSVPLSYLRKEVTNKHTWAHLLKQQTSITVYRLPTKENKIPFSVSSVFCIYLYFQIYRWKASAYIYT